MGLIILRDGTRVDLTEDQTMALAKMIMILPSHKLMKLNNIEFSIDDIDLEATRKAKLPQQIGLAIEVPTVDIKRRKSME